LAQTQASSSTYELLKDTFTLQENGMQECKGLGQGHDLFAARPEQLAVQHWQHFAHIAVQRCQGAFKREVRHFVLNKLRHGAGLVQRHVVFSMGSRVSSPESHTLCNAKARGSGTRIGTGQPSSSTATASSLGQFNSHCRPGTSVATRSDSANVMFSVTDMPRGADDEIHHELASIGGAVAVFANTFKRLIGFFE